MWLKSLCEKHDVKIVHLRKSVSSGFGAEGARKERYTHGLPSVMDRMLTVKLSNIQMVSL